MKRLATFFAVWLAFGRYLAHAEDMNCLGTIQTIAGNLWTVPSASSNPTCKARISAAAGERALDRLQDRSEMCVCWHRYPTRW